MKRIFLFLVLGLYSSGIAAPSGAGAKVLAESARVLQKSSHTSLEFELRIVDALHNTQAPQKGSLLLGPRDQFVLTLAGQQYLSDGITLWQYAPTQQQVLIKNVADLDGVFHPSEVLFKYLHCPVLKMQTTQLQGQKVEHLELDPQSQLPGYTQLAVWINQQHHPVQIVLRDNSDNVITYLISQVRTNVKATGADFKFKSSADIDEIDMR